MVSISGTQGLTLTAGGAEGSGLHGIVVKPDGALDGAADTRREGVALAP